MTAFEPLVDEPRWVAWRNEVRRNKPTKVPHSPHGGLAKADDPATWGTRAQAEALAAAIVNGTGGGIGIELGDLGADTYLAGIDLDSCIAADGCLALWAEKILSVVDTYAERSPSGTGVKVFFYASGDDVVPFLELIGVEPGSWGVKRSIGANGRDHGPAVEIYVSHRYFAVTGDLWPGKPERIALLSWKQLEQLVKLIPRKLGGPGGGGRDTSRSAKAFNDGARLRREGKTFEEMCAALRTHSDPDIASWCRDKGDLRQLRRIWDKAEPPTAAPPPYSEEA